ISAAACSRFHFGSVLFLTLPGVARMVPRLFRIGPRRRRYNNDPVTQRTRSRLLFPGGIFRPATMAPTIWIDGQYYDKANAKVSVFDHGLLYGDGVFEGIRVYDRRVFRLDKHLDRLYHSAKGAWLEIPMTKAELRRLVESVDWGSSGGGAFGRPSF